MRNVNFDHVLENDIKIILIVRQQFAGHWPRKDGERLIIINFMIQPIYLLGGAQPFIPPNLYSPNLYMLMNIILILIALGPQVTDIFSYLDSLIWDYYRAS